MPSRLNRLWARLRGFRQTPAEAAASGGPPRTHVVLLDGTMSSLRRGDETNIGLIYRLLGELPPDADVTIYYEPGIQWRGVLRANEVATGVGINRQIRRAYTFLARNYRPGDAIFLFGFSRGAFAVRSLAGMIHGLGLLRADAVGEDTVAQVYAFYREAPGAPVARALREAKCHGAVPIRLVGIFDTVRALGTKVPLLWRFTAEKQIFHDHALAPTTQHGRHALALLETREAYAPVLWQTTPERAETVQQMWFRGTHGDIGGHVAGFPASRPLANIPLTWMLGEAEALGLPLPEGWRARFPTDPEAPSLGLWRGITKFFWVRYRRTVGRDPSESLHPSTGLGPRDFDRVWVTTLPTPALPTRAH